MEDVGEPDPDLISGIWARLPILVNLQSVLEATKNNLLAVNRHSCGKGSWWDTLDIHHRNTSPCKMYTTILSHLRLPLPTTSPKMNS